MDGRNWWRHYWKQSNYSVKKAVLTVLMLVSFGYLSYANNKDMRKIKDHSDLIGKTFEFLTVISAEKLKNISCKCVCGSIKNYTFYDLNHGRAKSCGCRKAFMCADVKIEHGLSYHPLNRAYHQMILRCTKEKRADYRHYGGRGITVSKEWIDNKLLFFDWSFKNGWQWGLQLDRRNNSMGYSPENCRWVSRTVNMRNTRVNVFFEYKGEKKTLGEWCEILGLHFGTTKTRLYAQKLSVEEAFTRPVKQQM